MHPLRVFIVRECVYVLWCSHMLQENALGKLQAERISHHLDLGIEKRQQSHEHVWGRDACLIDCCRVYKHVSVRSSDNIAKAKYTNVCVVGHQVQALHVRMGACVGCCDRVSNQLFFLFFTAGFLSSDSFLPLWSFFLPWAELKESHYKGWVTYLLIAMTMPHW